MKKRLVVSFLTMLLVLSTVIPLNVGASEDISSTETIIMDGEKISFEREFKDGIRKVTIKNDKGEVLSEASVDIKTNEAILDGVKLSKKQFEDIVELGKEELENLENDSSLIEEPTNTISPMAANSCKYKKIGKTKYRSTWIPKTGVAAVAAAISVGVPGVGPSIAWSIASVVAGSTNTLYYTVKEYSCSKGGIYYLKTTRSFYKKSNYTGHVYTFSVYGSRR
jgi:hypothetical protein